MNEQERVPEWERYVEMIPEEMRAAGWTLWAVPNGPTVFGDPLYIAVLWKDLDDPNGARAAGDGATAEEAVRGAISAALALEAASQAQPPQE